MSTHKQLSAPSVITIDGPASAGKGTVAQLLADKLQFYYLDSGKLYRAVAWQAIASGLSPQNPKQAADIGNCAAAWAEDWLQQATGEGGGAAGREGWEGAVARLQNSDFLQPEISEAASYVAKIATVRQALLLVQQAFCRQPGLVADGRDMGTVVFSDAVMKVFLSAPVEVRAARRLAQLQEKKINAIMRDVLAGLKQRDARDTERVGAPLMVSKDSLVVDSSLDSAAAIVDKLVQEFTRRLKQ